MENDDNFGNKVAKGVKVGGTVLAGKSLFDATKDYINTDPCDPSKFAKGVKVAASATGMTGLPMDEDKLANGVGGIYSNLINRNDSYEDIMASAEGREPEHYTKPGCETAQSTEASKHYQQNSHVRQSPISLDLDGNGIEVLSYQNGSEAAFDFNNDGIKTHTSWLGKTDGILALDRDGDGQITSGQELFGDSTVLADGSKAALLEISTSVRTVVLLPFPKIVLHSR